MADQINVQGAVDRIIDDFTFEVLAQFEAAAITAEGRAIRELVRFCDLVAKGIPPAEREGIHTSVAARARRTIIYSYRQTVARRGPAGGGPSGYRPTSRFAGGRLAAALSADDYLVGTVDGIVLTVGPLNRKARQWARLNFGAGARGTGSLGPFPIRFNDMVVATLGLNEGARPGFSMPAGMWFAGGERVPWTGSRRGADAFRPGRPGLWTPTQGIAARNFLDQGVATIARELPRRWEIAIDDMVVKGKRALRSESFTIAGPGRVRRPVDLRPALAL